jgi:hypothetical protein
MFTILLPLYLTRGDLKQSLDGLTVRRILHVYDARRSADPFPPALKAA